MIYAEYRRDPDRILEEITRQERRNTLGLLKIFLGYASGVGKSAKLLDEGRRGGAAKISLSAQCSQDPPPRSNRCFANTKVIPTLSIGSKDVLDTDAIVQRKPSESWNAQIGSTTDNKFSTYIRDPESGLDYAMMRFYMNSNGDSPNLVDNCPHRFRPQTAGIPMPAGTRHDSNDQPEEITWQTLRASDTARGELPGFGECIRLFSLVAQHHCRMCRMNILFTRISN
jgi:hypothetical protein